MRDAPEISFVKESTNSDLTLILADCDLPYSSGSTGPYLLWKMYILFAVLTFI